MARASIVAALVVVVVVVLVAVEATEKRCKFDKDCASNNCLRRFKVCGKPKGTLGLGEACVGDSECGSKHCTGDVISEKHRKKLRGNSSTGHCSEKPGLWERFWHSLLASILPKTFESARNEFQRTHMGHTAGAIVRDYYLLKAVHTRHSPMVSKFEGRVRVVRVSLPKSIPEGQNVKIPTEIGDVWSWDHKYPSVEAFNKAFVGEGAGKLDRPAARVDLVTPPRYRGAMFSAVGVSFAFEREDSEEPFAYVLGAGMAAGEYVAYYVGETMSTRASGFHTGYVPTPLTTVEDRYHGTVGYRSGHPAFIRIASIHEGEEKPYIHVHARFELIPSGTKMSMRGEFAAFRGIIQASARLATVANAMGVDLFPKAIKWKTKKGKQRKLRINLNKVFVWLGKRLDWLVYPLGKDAPKVLLKLQRIERARTKKAQQQAKEIAKRDERMRNALAVEPWSDQDKFAEAIADSGDISQEDLDQIDQETE